MDLKAKPFYLSDEQIEWVNSTLKSMSQDDKIKQLFIDMAAPVPDKDHRGLVAQRKDGGLRHINKGGATN